MWEQIRSNRRRSVFVVTFMGVMLVATGIALGAALGGTGDAAILGGGVALVLWLILWLVTVTSGDQMLLGMAGARQIRKRDHPQLFNVVEEMTIASALPSMPHVYIVDSPSPNAFAAGRKPKNAAVAVTTGLLRILDRDELQGVVAHEIGHIKNRDVALMTTAGVMMGCIVLLAEVGLRYIWYSGGTRRSRTDSGDRGAGQAIALVLGLVFLVLAPILAQLIYLALSRRREYLADASGAMFTRYPEGLASALEKLGGSKEPLSDQSRVTAPMYIVRPFRREGGRSASSLFATHPPLADRIAVLRAMSGSAGFAEYEAAYGRIKHDSIVGARTLGEAVDVPIHGTERSDPSTGRERARTASNAFLAASGYSSRPCPSCGAIAKVPPSLQHKVTRCVRCEAPLGSE